MENQTLAELIESLRRAGLVYNDADFARKTGIKPSHISEMKGGKKPFTGYIRQRVEQSFPDFFNPTEDGTTENFTDVTKLVDVLKVQAETISAMAETKDRQIESLLSIIEAMSGAQKKAE